LLFVASKGTSLVYGSGFETQPELLEELALNFQLIGNQPETVRIIKDPGRFFSMLSRLGIPAPEVSMALPTASAEWLTKLVGGSGGTHVLPVMERHEAGRYYQRKVCGQPVSLLFLADGSKVNVVGYNLQLLAPVPTMPYRYGGAVSHFPLSENICNSMLQAAEKITAEMGLRGLNSLDCIANEENFWVLEVNPRLSATFALYDADHAGAMLFEGHMQASMGVMPEPLPQEPSQAHLIYYAPFDLTVPAAMEWPDWVADVPEPASRVEAEEPLCTVSASATRASQALALARTRAEALTRLVNNF
jgi:predicted ATP-grasp superfamily ATP-dependent carboligase